MRHFVHEIYPEPAVHEQLKHNGIFKTGLDCSISGFDLLAVINEEK
jgi:hypothetical protein